MVGGKVVPTSSVSFRTDAGLDPARYMRDVMAHMTKEIARATSIRLEDLILDIPNGARAKMITLTEATRAFSYEKNLFDDK